MIYELIWLVCLLSGNGAIISHIDARYQYRGSVADVSAKRKEGKNKVLCISRGRRFGKRERRDMYIFFG